MFCAAPTNTAAYKGVKPQVANVGANALPPNTNAKKMKPVVSNITGVMRAAVPQPNLRKMKDDTIMRQKVTIPVAVEKLPMNAEYSLGLGYWALILPFQVTSTRLMEIP